MNKTVKLLISLILFMSVCNFANADYIIQRFESGVSKPSFDEGEYYVRTTPVQEVTNYTTNNNYYPPTNTYYPNTYRIITPWTYYGYPYGTRYVSGTGININIGNNHHGPNPPPPPPSNTVGPGGRYVPQTPGMNNSGINYNPSKGIYNPSEMPSRALSPGAFNSNFWNKQNNDNNRY